MININNLNTSNYNKQYFNVISGIYGIYYNNKLLYIGSSNNLFKRLSIHRHWIRMKEKDNLGFLAYNLPVYKYIREYNIQDKVDFDIIYKSRCKINKDKLLKLEREYIIDLHPLCNKKLSY